MNQITGFTKEGKEQPAIPSGSSSQTRVAGFVGRLNYNYADKYYLEASLRHDGSYLFGGMNKRWVTLPGLSLAWRINNEKWFHATWVDNLKLRAGIGKTATSVSSLSNGEIRWHIPQFCRNRRSQSDSYLSVRIGKSQFDMGAMPQL